MRISDWSSDVCSSDLQVAAALLDDEFDHGKDLRLEWGMHDYRTGSTIAGFTRPREVSRKVGRIVLAIRDVPGGSTGWPLHWIESRLLSGGFASDSLSQAPAHLSGAGRHGIRRGRSRSEEHTSELQSLMRK